MHNAHTHTYPLDKTRTTRIHNEKNTWYKKMYASPHDVLDLRYTRHAVCKFASDFC